MQGMGFVSSWLGGGSVSHSRVASAAGAQTKICRAPSMALRGHEELETLFEGGDLKTAKYRLDLTISGETSKENRKLSVQQVKKNGNFNGFRKGTIPPFVMKQVEGTSKWLLRALLQRCLVCSRVLTLCVRLTFLFYRALSLSHFIEFVLRDCIESEIRDACAELDMKLLEGEASEPDLDFKELKSQFVISKDFDFSCDIALQTDSKSADDAEDAADAAENSDDATGKTANV